MYVCMYVLIYIHIRQYLALAQLVGFSGDRKEAIRLLNRSAQSGQFWCVMYVCMYVCMHVFVCACVYVFMCMLRLLNRSAQSGQFW